MEVELPFKLVMNAKIIFFPTIKKTSTIIVYNKRITNTPPIVPNYVGSSKPPPPRRSAARAAPYPYPPVIVRPQPDPEYQSGPGPGAN